MKEKKYNKLWFTLIEILVSITILWIIMISVFAIYIASSDINLKTDITRALQQNVKTSIEKLSEDIRKNGFECVQISPSESCLPWTLWNSDTLTGTLLKTNLWKYYLWSPDISWYWPASNSYCSETKNSCTLVHNWKPIMNSWVDVKNLEFRVTNHGVDKVTILMTLQPAVWKWIKTNLIENNKFYFQTTISERPNLN